MVQDGRRSAEEQTDPNPWPISEWTMADQAEINGARSLLLAPALGRPAPMASHTWCCTLRLLEPSARTVWAMCTRVSPWPPPHPRSLCHRRQLRLLGFSALHAPSLWFLSYPKPSCTAPERHPILQNLSRERRKQACAAASSLHPPTAYGPPHYYQPTLAYHHSTLSLAAPWPCSLLLPPLFLLPNHPPLRNHQTCGPAGDGTDLTAQTPHVWLAQRSPPPPPSFMLVRAFELRSTAQ